MESVLLDIGHVRTLGPDGCRYVVKRAVSAIIRAERTARQQRYEVEPTTIETLMGEPIDDVSEHFKYDTTGGWSPTTGAWSITGRDERSAKRAERPWTDIRTLGASASVYWSGLDSDERLTARPWTGAGIVLDAATRERIGSLLVPNSTDGLKGAKVSPSARGQGVTSRDDTYLALSPKQRAAQRKREQRARQRAVIDTTAERDIVKRNLAGTTAHGA